MSARRRKNTIGGNFSARLVETMKSPAFQVLSLAEHRILLRAEIELREHGGHDNGALPITYADFREYGVHKDAIAPALRALDALGLLKCTRRGRGGNSECRQPSRYLITYINSLDCEPTHEWRRVRTLEQARAIAEAARANKSHAAVSRGTRSHRRRNIIILDGGAPQ